MTIINPIVGDARKTRSLIESCFNNLLNGEITVTDSERDSLIKLAKEFGFEGISSILTKREEQLRITERSSDNSHGLWKMNSNEIAELFLEENHKTIDCLQNRTLVKQFSSIANTLTKQKAEVGNVNILLGGAGSSGRYAYLADMLFAEQFSSANFTLVPWIAGGVKALVAAVEHAEDNARFGYEAFRDFLSKANSFALPSSAGLSAPCVFGILKQCFDLRRECGVIGMNPLTRAARNSIPDFAGQSLSNLLSELSNKNLLNALTYVRGGESVTGSSRLGAGDATLFTYKILAELLNSPKHPIKSIIATAQQELRDGIEQVYSSYNIPQIMNSMAETIQKGGRIIYLSNDPVLGAIGMTDASECPPTFGAPAGVISTYFKDGWDSKLIVNETGSVKNNLKLEHPCDLDYFYKNITIHENDTIVILGSDPGNQLERRVVPKTNNIFRLDADPLSMKMVLNCLSSGAFTLSGAVIFNFMAHMKPSNSKLVERAARIVDKLTGVGLQNAAELVKEGMNIYTGKGKNEIDYTIPYCIARAKKFDKQESQDLLDAAKNPWGMVNVRSLLENIGRLS